MAKKTRQRSSTHPTAYVHIDNWQVVACPHSPNTCPQPGGSFRSHVEAEHHIRKMREERNPWMKHKAWD